MKDLLRKESQGSPASYHGQKWDNSNFSLLQYAQLKAVQHSKPLAEQGGHQGGKVQQQ